MEELARVIQICTLIGSIIFFLGSIFVYHYQESSQGMLPVIHYPFREMSSSFLNIAILLGLLFVIVAVIYEIKMKDK